MFYKHAQWESYAVAKQSLILLVLLVLYFLDFRIMFGSVESNFTWSPVGKQSMW